MTRNVRQANTVEKTARELLKLGIEIEKIAKATGLKKEEIGKITDLNLLR